LSSLVACCERGVRVRLLTDLYEEMTGRLLIEQFELRVGDVVADAQRGLRGLRRF
jgi:hypothetical protein